VYGGKHHGPFIRKSIHIQYEIGQSRTSENSHTMGEIRKFNRRRVAVEPISFGASYGFGSIP
jgi:hypothetical protein